MRALWTCLAAVVLAACAKIDAKPHAKRADPRWADYIAEHTTGRVPRKGTITLRFAKDVFAKEQEGRALEGLIETVPALKGRTLVKGPREAEFTPRGFLSGASYIVRVKPAALKGLPAGLGDFEFVLSVLERDLSLSVDGLFADAGDPSKWTLKGRVETADVEAGARVEKTLSAALSGEPVEISWTHEDGAKSHAFTIAGISRGKAARTLRLVLDGAAIDSRRRETKDVEVPADASFKVVEARAVSDGQQYALVSLSDPLDGSQDLRGLVRLSSGAFTARAEGATLKIFPQQRLIGPVGIVIEAGVRDARGRALERRFESRVVFSSQKPQVRFAGSGVILPDNEVLSIPFEALNVHAVQVTAFRVFAEDVGQFLQVNALPGDQELGRVGRFLWRKTIHLKESSDDSWKRYALDAGELLRGNRGALVRLTLSINRGDSDFSCSEEAAGKPAKADEPLKDNEDLNAAQPSGWDGVEEWYDEESPAKTRWSERADPCADAYYQFAPGVKDSRNFLASNIGLLATRGARGELRVVASNLRTAEPLAGVALAVRNFQGAIIGSGETDARGFAAIEPKGKPFYLTARKDGDRGYLKLSDGVVLPMSHFDVGGEKVEDGLKGFLYGERGVWRPGDEMDLVLIVEDREGRLPKDHPAVLRLYDPKGRLAQTLADRKPVDGFYRFSVRTPEDAPTGLWSAKARVGGAEFSKELRVEAVMPNRLKIELDFGRKSLRAKAVDQRGRLFAQWLHGAKAGGLKADVSLKLAAEPTRFTRFADHVFDDPARAISAEPVTVFDGKLDEDGRASFPLALPEGQAAPGMVSAQFHSRVFEEGGAFSSMHQVVALHPYDRYIGLKLPQGDHARGMLMTDTTHQVSLVSLDYDGNPVSVPDVQVTLYKLGWKWWWDKSGETLAQFASGSHADVVLQEKASIKDGRGRWNFKIQYPAWGRYLLRACDVEGGHCAGQVFYIDWPGWAGRAREQSGVGASVLSFDADKTEYRVGQTARVSLPAAANARALLAVENGTRVLSQRWVALSSSPTTVPIAITKAMTPNVYVSAFVIQPHKDKASDRPIRLYGVLPLAVKDPSTELSPVVETAAEWRPETRARVVVSEAKGRPMTYTLAVVDEGLLGLTDFKTPDPHAHFYKKEALGVSTWDLYDHVVGAYGGDLERLLALGGSEALGELREKDSNRRFPPIVRFFGPFELKPGEKRVQDVPLSAYVGALRVMVVAGRRGAYGRAEKSVPVRQPLMIQPTLPRVVGPGEEITVPVSVFATGDKIKRATVSIAADGPFSIAGPAEAEVAFGKPGETLAFFKLRSGARLGAGTIRVAASSGGEKARAEVRLAVRPPNVATSKQVGSWIEPGATWRARVTPHGLAGTNELVLETSSLPPLNLEARLGELIRYPYGCLEQTTSILFPQFFLPGLVKLSDVQKAELEKNIRGGLDRLRGFQAPNGGFLYWPGPGSGGPQTFATSYVGQFLIEAERRGYALPPEMLAQWEKFQRERALAWSPGGAESDFEQAYRLYTLALAGKAELGAMNLLREQPGLRGLARWMLAGAYQAAGIAEASDALAQSADGYVEPAGEAGQTFRSPLRDKALILQVMTLRKDLVRAKPFAEEVSASLSSEQWHHTQALAQSLTALARYYGEQDGPRGVSYEVSVGRGKAEAVSAQEPIERHALRGFAADGADVSVRNTGPRRLFALLVSRGVPAAGGEAAASNGLSLEIDYVDQNGRPLDPARLSQGEQATALVRLKNETPRRLENLALTFLAPAGWEIQNARWDGGASAGANLDYQDVRDDRVLSFLGLGPGERAVVPMRLTAAYLGRYYLPAAKAEAMYESSLNANTEGRWVAVESGR